MGKVWVCSAGCAGGDFPFYFPSYEIGVSDVPKPGFGVAAYPDCRPSQYWTDGSDGVSQHIQELCEEWGWPWCIACDAGIVLVTAEKAASLKRIANWRWALGQ